MEQATLGSVSDMSSPSPARRSGPLAELSGQATAGLPAVSAGLSRQRQLAALALLLLGLPVLTSVLVTHRDRLSYATPVLVVLILVVVVALVGGLRVALPAAVLGGLVLNWFFTPPFNTFAVERPDQLLALGVYLGLAIAVSVIVDLAARRTAEATRARAEARELSSLAGSTLAGAQTLPDLLERVRAIFRMREVTLLEKLDGQWSPAASVSGGEPEPGEVELRVHAGPGLALSALGPPLFAEDKRVLASFAEAAATALEGRRLAQQAQTNAELEAADRMHTALLAAVGHDLRTPLAGIKAAVTSLRQGDVEFDDIQRDELLDTVETSADRLQVWWPTSSTPPGCRPAPYRCTHSRPAWRRSPAGWSWRCPQVSENGSSSTSPSSCPMPSPTQDCLSGSWRTSWTTPCDTPRPARSRPCG